MTIRILVGNCKLKNRIAPDMFCAFADFRFPLYLFTCAISASSMRQVLPTLIAMMVR